MLVGNAVSVPVSRWLGKRLRHPRQYDASGDTKLNRGQPWPKSAWCVDGECRAADVSTWPVARPSPRLEDFLRYPPRLLSARAAGGFYSRARKSNLRFPDGFLPSVKHHIVRMGGDAL